MQKGQIARHKTLSSPNLLCADQTSKESRSSQSYFLITFISLGDIMLIQPNRHLKLISLLCLIILCSLGQGQSKKQVQAPKTSTLSTASIAGPGSGTIINMQVFISNDIDETLGNGSITKLASPVWTYNKISNTSTLRINYQEVVTHTGQDAGTCQWQIRVDGQQSPHLLCDPLNPGIACLYLTPPLIVVSNVANISLNTSGLFRGLAAGDHEISIYQRSVGATQCIRNSGGSTTTVTVEEIELP
jgi:hypothetical protein